MKRFFTNRWNWSKNSWKIENFFNSRSLIANLFCLTVLYSWIIFINANYLNLTLIVLFNLPLFFKPKYLLVSLNLLSVLLIVWIIFRNTLFNQESFYETKFIVYKKTDSYFLIKNQRTYFILFKKTYDFNLGDEITISGDFKLLENDSKSWYFKSLRISGIVVPKSVYVSNSYFNFQNVLNNFVENKGSYFKKYFLLLTFGFSSEDSESVYDVTKNLGVLHLIIISGFHFNLLFGIFKKLFAKFSAKYCEMFALILISVYYLLIDKNPSTFRAFFTILFVTLVKLKYKTNIKSYATFIVGILAIVINPFVIVRQGFWYSYIISIFIFNFSIMLKKIKSKFWNYLVLSLLIYFLSFLISIVFNNKINLLGYINILIITPLCEFLIFNNLVFWWFSSYLDLTYKIFEFVLNLLSYVTYLVQININLNFIVVPIVIYILFLLINFIYFKKPIEKNL